MPPIEVEEFFLFFLKKKKNLPGPKLTNNKKPPTIEKV
jgi:hypothetical protein